MRLVLKMQLGWFGGPDVPSLPQWFLIVDLMPLLSLCRLFWHSQPQWQITESLAAAASR